MRHRRFRRGAYAQGDGVSPGVPPKLALALDADPETALELVERTDGVVDVLKMGQMLWGEAGPVLVRDLVTRSPVFLDLKLHDIPAQVEGAAGAAADLGAALLTVHASGGPAMVEAAVRGVEGRATSIVAVTVLTSLDDADLYAIGVRDDASKQVLRLAELALGAGAHGLVCSPREVAALRERFGPEPILVVPGIRPDGAGLGDQKRTLTPRGAAEAGASVIVVGRPITAASDPRSAAEAIRDSLT